ncbi:MAG: ABC transporter ATP-binding protein [Rickettsiaceae bacterium]|nr:ABC transporter ATP-binding protein [Rickettsiaceae bacterium]
MTNEIFVKIKNCSLSGIDSIKRVQSLRQMFLKPGKISGSVIPILKDISFSCKSGDRVALVGGNGSGKSSILKLIAGIYPPAEGTIRINGKITSIIEMGLGVESEFSGRQNIKILMLYNNMLDRYSKEFEQKVIDFSELGEKIDQSIKNFSSGMLSRLAFSICIFQTPDILLLDEVFAAGDGKFIKKSLEFMKNKINTVPITILVSHQESIIKEHCNRCILVKNGRIVEDGDTDRVLSIYNSGNY